jgi:hypothetical protein
MRRAFVVLIGSVVCVFEADDTRPTADECFLIGWFPANCVDVRDYVPPGSAFERWILSILGPPKPRRPPVRGTPRALARARGRRARA